MSNSIAQNRIDILSVGIDKLSYRKVLVETIAAINFGRKLFIVTANAEGLMLTQRDEKFKQAISKANLVTADGVGLIWAARFLNYRVPNNFLKYLVAPFLVLFSLLAIVFHPSHLKKILPERVSGSDLFWEIVRKAYEEDKSIFLLGGRDGIAQQVKEKLEKKFEGIKIVGVYPGNPKEKNLVERVNGNNPDILFVAWGQPKQEKWIAENLDKINAKVLIGVGGTFDFVAGRIKRAPNIFQKLGLEWLWRLFQEPKRIGRIFTAVPKFIFAVTSYKLRMGNNDQNETG